MLSYTIDQLLNYGVDSGLIPECERIYTRNLLLNLFQEDEYKESNEVETSDLETILGNLLDEAVHRGLIEDTVTHRDLFDTKIMNSLMPRPSQVREKFWSNYEKSPKEATDYFYKLSQDSDYIRRYRIKKDVKWFVDSAYGDIDLTINLSKPEKDPKAIAAAGKASSSSYPKCLLCKQNEGYAGRLNSPARDNHRIVDITIDNQGYGLQYSPYVYYNEHCIVFNSEHTPMKIDRETFARLLDFVTVFPHYFIGSNADLPIVGGSILSHDHFQGGNYKFAMEKAEIEEYVTIKGFEDVKVGIVKWPMSNLRVQGEDKERVLAVADHILKTWRGYSDEEAFIFAETDGTPHNTITPIARRVGEIYEMDLVLRNNITTEEHPLGVFHPHEQLHHIKKENIGLIEVMGLAVLPSRLKTEMELVQNYLVEGKDISSNEQIEKHADWANGIKERYAELTAENIESIVREEVGQVFVQVLKDAGVFKDTVEGRDAFRRFIAACNA